MDEAAVPVVVALLIQPTLLWGALKLFKVPKNSWFQALIYYLGLGVLAVFCLLAAGLMGFGPQGAMLGLIVLAFWLLMRMYDLSLLQALIVTVTANVLIPFAMVAGLAAMLGTSASLLKLLGIS